MIGPLVENIGTHRLHQIRYAVLGDHHQSQRGNQLVDPVVDLRVDMVRSAAQDDGLESLLTCKFQRLAPFLLHLLPLAVVAFIGTVGRPFDLAQGQIRVIFFERLPDFFREGLALRQIQIRIKITHLLELFDVGSQQLGVVGDHRTVEMVVTFTLIKIVAHAGVKDGGDPFVQQIFDMSVHQLCRIAGGVRRNRVLPFGIQRAGGQVGYHNIKVQVAEKCLPEEQIFIHIQSQRQPNHPAFTGVGSRSFSTVLTECANLLQLKAVQIGQLPLFSQSQRLFAAVAGNIPLPACKDVDGEVTVVGAALADHRLGFMLEIFQLLCAEHRRAGLLLWANSLCVDGSAVGSHQTGNVRSNDVMPDFLFKAAQNGIVEEGSSLHHDMFAQLVRIPCADDFI